MLVLLKWNGVEMFFSWSLISVSGQTDRRTESQWSEKCSSWPDIVRLSAVTLSYVH